MASQTETIRVVWWWCYPTSFER